MRYTRTSPILQLTDSALRQMSDYLGKWPQFSVATFDTMDDNRHTIGGVVKDF